MFVAHGNRELELEAHNFKLFKDRADKGSCDSQLIVAQMYQKGIGVGRSSAAAFHYYKRAARGSPEAQFQVFCTFPHFLAACSLVCAVFHFLRSFSAQVGYMMLRGGYGARQNNAAERIEKAAKYIKMAADSGNCRALVYMGHW